MTALVPDPSTLGLESPTLGPWFSTDVTLEVPGDDLGVAVTIPAGTDWLPPATGLLSFAMASTPLPPILAGLRGPSGSPPFTAGRLVAVFRLLPEVEQRLAALLADVPAADGTTAAPGLVTRAAVRTFALELPEDPPTLAVLKTRVHPPIPVLSSPSEEAEHVGLSQSGGDLDNGVEPMTDLKRPGQFFGPPEKLLTFPASTAATLYAFDARGRVIDPGAVAAWWARLTRTFTNLFAAGVTQRTATVDPRLTVQLVGPDDAPASAAILSRLTVTNVTGSGPVRVRGGADAAAGFALTGGTVDDAPLPLLAALPAGTYGAAVNLWAGGAVGDVTRDFVRVALVDVERHLTGQPRVAGSGANADDRRRADDQKRSSTRTLVAQATVNAGESVLLATADAAMSGLLAVLSSGSATMVAPVLDRAAGALSAPSPPTVGAPAALPGAVTITALTGGGTDDDGTVVGQRVLLQTTVDPSLAGAWLRVWPQYFDSANGRHVRGAGGGGLVDATGAVRAVVRLADGAVEPGNRMGLDLMLVTAAGAVRYPEVRLERPAPVGGAMASLPSITDTVVACETGQSFTGGVPAGALVSGVTLVALSTPPALVDPASIPAAQWTSATVAASLTAGDVVQLTEPAWKGWRGGEDAAALAGSATATQILRTGLTRLTQIGAPLPTQSRDEVAAVVLSATVADGAVAGVRPLGAHHELLPHQNGHPGAPTDDERHGAGARLRGPAVAGLAEILRERVSGTTAELATDASTPLATPAAPAVPASWAATLRTVGFGVEAEPGLVEALNLTGQDAFPLDGTLTAVQAWLSARGITIPAGVGGAAASMLRAVDRRLLGARSGYREAATALAAVFARAQDFVYIETPALDGLAVGTGDATINVWQALALQMQANPVLRVLVCLPSRLTPGTPAKLQRVRDRGVREALDAMRAAAGDRLAVFNPVTGPGRSLHLDATSVVVDDAWALTGGTHLWRRGLSFDASLAVAVFDERLTDGRPADVVAFRRALIAGRLGLAPTLLPEDPVELVSAVRQLSTRGGGLRLSPEPIQTPEPMPSDFDTTVWNPDGSPVSSFNAMAWIAALVVDVQAELQAEIPGSP
ncbi:hypothetical protein GCM10023194_69430 [Planotetraspora phitsanulokensis]|uniref:PLD phosphodiesterase domain-containing protein n=1 Tax=Planotetraspora phitsanulokensis TaxID=575192 RepID=A0A8J3UE42_9ACTN|nr:hypothetical protein [Planotetraspora phitsanulokensis]GII43090.1 hypothetical protein Pph01_80930 [Planotetraspora phitsanulokensis]